MGVRDRGSNPRIPTYDKMKDKKDRKSMLNYILNGGIVGRPFIDKDNRIYTVLNRPLGYLELESDTQVSMTINRQGEGERIVNLLSHLKDREA